MATDGANPNVSDIELEFHINHPPSQGGAIEPLKPLMDGCLSSLKPLKWVRSASLSRFRGCSVATSRPTNSVPLSFLSLYRCEFMCCINRCFDI